MRTDAFDYALPAELIAQTPLPRGQSRLLVLHQADGHIEHTRFPALFDYLRAGDTLVVNDSRVIARRYILTLESGRRGEALLLRPRGETEWEALVRPGKRMRPGSIIYLHLRNGDSISATVGETTPDGGRVLSLPGTPTRDRLASEGTPPLPPYIHAELEDEERYQTVYAGQGGSAAAPTAGLHFTPEMLSQAERAGIGIARITLHVGVDTFRPVKTESVAEHRMHGEWFTISPDAAVKINTTEGRVIAVGTTAVRALESAAAGTRSVAATTAETRLFITPGYRFQIVDGLLTNFHLPKSTLLMLVSAFAGKEAVMAAYRSAIEQRYRFYSFGDAMLLI